MKNFRLILFLGLLIWSVPSVSAQKFTADLIVVNANVRTLDAAKPRAEAIAVWQNKIVAVGSNAEIKTFAGATTRTIDARGKLVMPGFNDAHVHFMDGGAGLSSVDLRDAKTPAEFVERIKNFAAKLPKGHWILNGNWDHENWTPANLPTAAMIDPRRPIIRCLSIVWTDIWRWRIRSRSSSPELIKIRKTWRAARSCATRRAFRPAF